MAKARKALNEALKIEWGNGMITLNEWRVKNGDDPLTDARGKMYFPEYVKQYGDPDKPVAATKPNDNGNERDEETES